MQKGAIFTIVSQATTLLVLFVQKVDDAIRLKNLDPVDSAIGFSNIYSMLPSIRTLQFKIAITFLC